MIRCIDLPMNLSNVNTLIRHMFCLINISLINNSLPHSHFRYNLDD